MVRCMPLVLGSGGLPMMVEDATESCDEETCKFQICSGVRIHVPDIRLKTIR